MDTPKDEPAKEDEPVLNPATDPEPKKKEPAEPAPTKLEDLSPELQAEIQKRIDQARTQASKTASANATHTATEKMQAQLDAMSLQLNQEKVKNILNGAGIAQEMIDSVLPMIATTDAKASEDSATAFAKAFSGALEKAVKAKTKQGIDHMPVPKGAGGSGTKAFKDMTYMERIAFKTSNPQGYKEAIGQANLTI